MVPEANVHVAKVEERRAGAAASSACPTVDLMTVLYLLCASGYLMC